jgi:hypothetical protein
MKSVILTVFLFVGALVIGQSNHSNISFDEYVYDFKYINEKDGEVEHVFHFVNKGEVPFSIIEVISECGCTVPVYTEGVLHPGDSGTVKAIFNPEAPINKEFNKYLTIRVTNDTALIKIKGHIIPFVRPKEVSMFTEKIGDTWFRASFFQFGKMTNNSVYVEKFDVYNTGDDSLSLTTDTLPDYLTVSFHPEIIAPKSFGEIELSFDAAKKDDYGYFTEGFILMSNEDTLAIKNMSISGNIAEYFSDTVDLETAPKAVLGSPATVNLATVLISTPKAASFIVKNEGEEVLVIRKISSPCSCIQVEILSGTEIKPGEEVTLKATLNGRGRKKGNISKPFYIYVNDPVKPILQFGIKAYLK